MPRAAGPVHVPRMAAEHLGRHRGILVCRYVSSAAGGQSQRNLGTCLQFGGSPSVGDPMAAAAAPGCGSSMAASREVAGTCELSDTVLTASAVAASNMLSRRCGPGRYVEPR